MVNRAWFEPFAFLMHNLLYRGIAKEEVGGRLLYVYHTIVLCVYLIRVFLCNSQELRETFTAVWLMRRTGRLSRRERA